MTERLRQGWKRGRRSVFEVHPGARSEEIHPRGGRVRARPADGRVSNKQEWNRGSYRLLRLMTLDRTLDLRFVDEDNFTHAHNEWRTYVVRPAQDIADYVRPTWTRDAAGVTSYRFA